MEILFLGTGAADWPNPGAQVKDGRRLCSMLLDTSVLIDCGPMTLDAIKEFHVNPDLLTDIIISHPHGDHFNFPVIQQLALLRSPNLPPLRLHLNLQATLRAVPSETTAPRLTVQGYLPGDEFDCHGYQVKTMAANHPLEIPNELAAHFLITTPSGECLFYLLDGSWMPHSTWRKLSEETLSPDIVVWEMTCGNLDDWRVREHCNLGMISLEAKALQGMGFLKPGIPMFCSHLMRGATDNMNQLRAEVSAAGFILADDGMRFQTKAAETPISAK